MKIYRFALQESIVKQILKGTQKRPFSQLFGDKMRIVIPLKNETLLHIVNLLEKGKTITKTVYRVDLDNKVAYRYITKDNKTTLDPRPMRLGKVVFKELGKDYADQWSVQENSIQNEDYSIIISRDPIDIVRMSDHHGIDSCHSPVGDYFASAKQEAMDGGAIAYLVENEDLNLLFSSRGGTESLQDTDIFEDTDRGIRGIEPKSRLRINRYFDEYDNEKQLAVPVNRLYGLSRVAGFFDTIRQFLYSEQEKFTDYDDIYMRDYKRAGGDYSDERDKQIMIDFFGNNMGVTSNLDHEGGNLTEIYNEELEKMAKEINDQLTYSSVFASADDEGGYTYISAYVNVEFRVRGSLTLKNDYLDWERVRELKKELELSSKISIDEVNVEEENEIVKIIIRGNLNESGEIRNPDDFEYSANDIVKYEENNYISDSYEIRNYFLKTRIIIPISDFDEDDHFAQSIKNYLSRDISCEDGMIVMAIPINYKLKEEIWGWGKEQEREKIKADIKNLFTDIVKRELRSYQDMEKKQMKFPFYEDDASDVKINYVPRFQVSFTSNIAGTGIGGFNTERLNTRKILINIAETELIEAGQAYYTTFLNMMGRIYHEIARFLQYKHAEGSNIEYNKEWSKYVQQDKLPQQGGENIVENDQAIEQQKPEAVQQEVVSANRGNIMNWYKKAIAVEVKDVMEGKADKEGVTIKDVDQNELQKGIKIETEHTSDKSLAKKIALDHLAEIPDYYSRLKKMEDQAGK